MKAIEPPTRRKKGGHYAPGMLCHGLLFVSGQLPLDPDTDALPEGGVAAHARQALANLERVLTAAGLTRQSVVQCRVYIPDVALWDEVDRVYAGFFGDHKPARVVVPCGALHHGALIEIEAVAQAEED